MSLLIRPKALATFLESGWAVEFSSTKSIVFLFSGILGVVFLSQGKVWSSGWSNSLLGSGQDFRLFRC